MTVPDSEQLASRSAARQGVSAANLPVVQESTASPEVQLLYQRYRDGFGRSQVPGILQCFATHPPLLRHMLSLAQEMLFVDGALGRQNKELISTYVSSSNLCNYCADSHACAFRMQGGTHAAIHAVLACDLLSENLTPQRRILLEFAHKITQASQSVSPTDIESMRLAGFSDLQIAEAIHITSLFAAFNRVVNSFGLPSQHLLEAFEQEEQAHAG